MSDERPPSKSQRKRDAHALQELAESLVDLPDSQFSQVPMPDHLRDAVLDTRRMKSHGALTRQRQYLGRLMRDIDPEPIRTALEGFRDQARREHAAFHRIEAWRDRLIDEGDDAMGELLGECPDADRQHLRRLIRDARRERSAQRPPKSARALFRYLRGLLVS